MSPKAYYTVFSIVFTPYLTYSYLCCRLELAESAGSYEADSKSRQELLLLWIQFGYILVLQVYYIALGSRNNGLVMEHQFLVRNLGNWGRVAPIPPLNCEAEVALRGFLSGFLTLESVFSGR